MNAKLISGFTEIWIDLKSLEFDFLNQSSKAAPHPYQAPYRHKIHQH